MGDEDDKATKDSAAAAAAEEDDPKSPEEKKQKADAADDGDKKKGEEGMSPMEEDKKKDGEEDKEEEEKEKEEETPDEEMKDEEKEEEADDDKKKRKSAAVSTPENNAGSPSNKRERRSRSKAQTFQPDDFLHVDKSITVPEGRGAALKDLPATREQIEKYASKNSDDMYTAHKFLFAQRRGKPAKKEMKANLLEFSGYLPPKKEDADQKEQEKIDEECESKMGTKAYKMTVPHLKKLCDFFAVDRTSLTGKDALVDVLLDFLGEPNANLLKGGSGGKTKKKSTSAKKKSSKKAEDKSDEDSDEEADYSDLSDSKIEDAVLDEEDGGDDDKKESSAIPDDKKLRKWVKAYVRCHNMRRSTIKNAIAIASDKFGVDITEKKQRLKEILTEEM